MQHTRRSGPRSGALLLALFWLGCTGKTSEPGLRPASARGGTGASTAGAGAAAGSGSSGPLAGGSGSPRIAQDEDAGSSSAPSSLVISPAARTVGVDPVDPQPIAFKVMLNDGSASAIAPRWTAEPRELGSIDSKTGMFKPSGAAGTLTLTVSAGSLTTTVMLALNVKRVQEGDPDADKLPAGAGGVGGVGGEGGGSKITDAKLRAALDGSAQDDAELRWLYPYEGTVWPRGLPAPLLQWSHGAHAPLAVKLHLEVGTAFVADMYLGAPAALGGGKPIDRLPLPQAIWQAGLLSGSSMKVSLTIAADNGMGGYATYKAPQSLSWTVAPTTLKGVVYYNSYGTKLAENFNGAKGGNGRFGGATLAIRGGAFDPELVAGSTTTDDAGCRVCHTVAANGSRLIVQRQNYTGASAYDLRNKNAESMYAASEDKKFGWAALSPDGSVALGSAGPPGSDTGGPSSLPTSGLYRTSDGSALTARNLSSFVTQAATPAFSPDMSMVGFNFFGGPGNATITGNGQSLVVMDVKKIDDATYDFGNPRVVYKAATSGQLPGWPFFLPDGSGVVFQIELAGDPRNRLQTWHGARGELWWADLAGHAHALDRANGTGYLPSAANGHDADNTLQYEPTVAPIVAGGYAWVVFTSRRAYGNVATRGPFESDPREFDLTPGNAAGPTPKKLWVSAISLPAKADTDPSHPAFYLPAQELYAGNSRGFWVLDACKEDKANCSSGDECCGGYCSVSEEFGVGVCSKVPPDTCSKEYDKCNVTADCCAGKGLMCIGGRCATQSLQ
jgi:hypothetical protein